MNLPRPRSLPRPSGAVTVISRLAGAGAHAVRGVGVELTVNRTRYWIQPVPFDWEIHRSLMAPAKYGLGVAVTVDGWTRNP